MKTALAAGCLLLGGVLSHAQAQKSVLPEQFEGWQKAASKVSANVGGENAAALKEFGIISVESAQYKRDNRTIQVSAYQFPTTTGSLGAFTYLADPRMTTQQLCDGGAMAELRVLFHCTNVVVDVALDKSTAMSAAQMRALAGLIPRLTGSEAVAPSVMLHLPKNPDRINQKLAIGPESLKKSGSPLPPALIDFSLSPEIAVDRNDGASIIVISYPTHQIAIQQMKRLEEWKAALPKPDGEEAVAELKRSGPLVAVVTGNVTKERAAELLGEVNYDANVTVPENTFNGPRNNIGGIVYNAMLLAIFIGLGMLVLGVVFGFFRVMANRLMPGKIVNRAENVEIIRLKLDE